MTFNAFSIQDRLHITLKANLPFLLDTTAAQYSKQHKTCRINSHCHAHWECVSADSRAASG
jgi:hypothetical protein